MKTYHIHIQGIVQGVGFRPFIYRLAKKHGILGWVNNTNDGVHIKMNSHNGQLKDFIDEMNATLPPLAYITALDFNEIESESFREFEIIESDSKSPPKLLLTPDVALCDDCRDELYNRQNRRFHYPFITCTNCGPRYSIIKKLPYDRPFTTMEAFKMCSPCDAEYNNPMERRHFSQTNSCPECKIEMQIYENGQLIPHFENLDYITKQWKRGKIIAIKGIGGYLLTCDANNIQAVSLLRKRKLRPTKPLALMYPDLETIKLDAFACEEEIKELKSIHSPIVLLRKKTKTLNLSNEALDLVAGKLNRIGVILPYTPLFELLLNKFKRPIVATSGNISNSGIIYKDDTAIKELSKMADIILLNNREIVIPQDDGVVQFSALHRKKITIRRSRGKAPTYINPQIEFPIQTIFSAGAMLKSVFGIFNQKNCYISQYLGNTEHYEAQLNYENSFRHLAEILKCKIDVVVADKHPDYFSTRFAKELKQKYQTEYIEIQHHKAHFYSVLGENNLLNTKDKILGIIWDGTGLGDDGNIWGGEFFVYQHYRMERVSHLPEYEFILADKMIKEPRISLLCMAYQISEFCHLLKDKFTNLEWNIYAKLLEGNKLKATSMGRLFDAVACLLLNIDIQNEEAEAAMALESIALEYFQKQKNFPRGYPIDDVESSLIAELLKNILEDKNKGEEIGLISLKFHITLVDYIKKLAQKFNISKLAFSGGVFQNSLLVDLIIERLAYPFELFFHREFSPNDEGIAFGQLMASIN